MKILIFLLILFLCSHANANEFALYYNVNDSLKIGFLGAPYASFTSEYGVSGGITIHIFEKNLSKEIISGQDYWMRIDGEYSENNERGLTLEGRIPIRTINQLIYYELSHRYKPKEYYGIGGNTNKDNAYIYNQEHYRFLGSLTRLFTPRFSGGIAWDYSSFYNNNLNSEQDYPDVLGFDEKYKTVGLGTSITYNTKIPNNFPSTGIYYKNEFLIYDKKINSDYFFITLKNEFQYFYSINNHIIANQLLLNNTFKNVPFHYYPEQGGAKMMRGLSTGRYIDLQFLGLQSEYRSPIWFWRFSGVCFLAGGISYSGAQDLVLDNINITGGLGLRLALDKEDRVNGRFDVGLSKDGFQVYLKFGEVF